MAEVAGTPPPLNRKKLLSSILRVLKFNLFSMIILALLFCKLVFISPVSNSPLCQQIALTYIKVRSCRKKGQIVRYVSYFKKSWRMAIGCETLAFFAFSLGRRGGGGVVELKQVRI